jgi:hypothetical protein
MKYSFKILHRQEDEHRHEQNLKNYIPHYLDSSNFNLRRAALPHSRKVNFCAAFSPRRLFPSATRLFNKSPSVFIRCFPTVQERAPCGFCGGLVGIPNIPPPCRLSTGLTGSQAVSSRSWQLWRGRRLALSMQGFTRFFNPGALMIGAPVRTIN